MATESIVGGLFGMTPEMYQQEQSQRALSQAAELAQLDPFALAKTGIGYGANRLAGAVGGMLGGEDPQLKLISTRNALARQFDINSPQGLAQYAQALQQAGDVQGGLQASRMSQELGLAAAKTRKETMAIEQEEKLRNELVALGPNASQADVLRTVTKYGSPDKILASLEASNRAAEANATRLQIAEGNQRTQMQVAEGQAAARIEAARIAGATAQQIAQMRQDSALQIAQMNNDFKLQNLDLKRQLLANQPLKPQLQKEEDNDFKLIDNLKSQVGSLEPVIASLTIDPQTGKPPLELGPVNNAKYQAANAMGRSTPESRAYANLERAVQNATNLKTDAAKGVQTDKDVLRFANELIAAFGANDTQTSLDALNNFYKSTVKAEENTKKRIDSRRTSQGVQPYYGPTAGTAKNPIKLD